MTTGPSAALAIAMVIGLTACGGTAKSGSTNTGKSKTSVAAYCKAAKAVQAMTKSEGSAAEAMKKMQALDKAAPPQIKPRVDALWAAEEATIRTLKSTGWNENSPNPSSPPRKKFDALKPVLLAEDLKVRTASKPVVAYDQSHCAAG